MIEDNRAVLLAYIWALAVHLCRVVYLEETPHESLIRDSRGIESHLYRLGMTRRAATHLLVAWVLYVPACIARHYLKHPQCPAKGVLNTPEAPGRERCLLTYHACMIAKALAKRAFAASAGYIAPAGGVGGAADVADVSPL